MRGFVFCGLIPSSVPGRRHVSMLSFAHAVFHTSLCHTIPTVDCWWPGGSGFERITKCKACRRVVLGELPCGPVAPVNARRTINIC